MWPGVGKSGSPAPKLTTLSPAALSAFALASIARVADSAMAATRREIRSIRRLSSAAALAERVPSTVLGFETDSPRMVAHMRDDNGIELPRTLLPADGRFG